MQEQDFNHFYQQSPTEHPAVMKVVTIEGERESGKTRLLNLVLEQAGPHGVMLSAEGWTVAAILRALESAAALGMKVVCIDDFNGRLIHRLRAASKQIRVKPSLTLYVAIEG